MKMKSGTSLRIMLAMLAFGLAGCNAAWAKEGQYIMVPEGTRVTAYYMDKLYGLYDDLRQCTLEGPAFGRVTRGPAYWETGSAGVDEGNLWEVYSPSEEGNCGTDFYLKGNDGNVKMVEDKYLPEVVEWLCAQGDAYSCDGVPGRRK